MMREIIFRGKRTDNGEWVEGYYVSTRAAEHIIIPLGTQWCGGAEFDKGYLVDPDTVGQYTGLKDKNGKRIFEGDIVRIEREEWGFDGTSTEYRNELGTIAYDDWGMVGLIVETYEDRPVWSDFFHVLGLTDRVRECSFEIICNIHDNPELIGGNDGT